MSEPESAFLKLHVSRANLVRWLDAPVARAASWTDWREIGGSYYFDAGPGPIEAIGDAELAEQVAECDAGLSRFATNRDGLRFVLDMAEAPWFRRCAYDEARPELIVGTLTYAENLILSMQFLTIARGAAAALGPDGDGIAIVHSYAFEQEEMGAAVRLRPGPSSAFLRPEEMPAAVAVFRPIADEMLAVANAAGWDPAQYPAPIDGLASLA